MLSKSQQAGCADQCPGYFTDTKIMVKDGYKKNKIMKNIFFLYLNKRTIFEDLAQEEKNTV